VSIKSGKYRGMMGAVRSATATMVRVELHARPETVNVDRSNIVLIGGVSGSMGGSYGASYSR
jgi:transcription elongation factor